MLLYKILRLRYGITEIRDYRPKPLFSLKCVSKYIGVRLSLCKSVLDQHFRAIKKGELNPESHLLKHSAFRELLQQ